MYKKIAIIVAVLFGLNAFRAWVFSDDFQDWADESNASWTCPLTMFLGDFENIFSDYDRAIQRYERVLKRCPKSRYEEEALYKIADQYYAKGDYTKTIQILSEFREKYPKSRRSDLAQRRLSTLRIR